MQTDDRHARSKTVEHNKAERLAIRRHAEDIAACKRLPQGLSAQNSDKHSFGALETLSQSVGVVATANNNQVDVGILVEHSMQFLDVLLAPKTPDVDHQDVVGVAVGEHVVRRGVFLPGLETHRIDFLAPYLDALDALLLKLCLDLRAGHKGEVVWMYLTVSQEMGG